LGKAVGEAGKLEQLQVGFTTILGSADAARAKLAELQDFAAKTPFNFQGTAALAKQLVAMGTSADDVVPVMRDLGDATAALGLGQESLQRIVFNFGQIQTSGKLTTRELRDFAINGIPAFKILQEELGLTADQVQSIGDEGISSERGLAALRAGLQKRYSGAMEAQNKTLFGSWSNLTDSLQRFGATAGGPALGGVTALVRGTTALIDGLNTLPGSVTATFGVGLAAGLGIYAVSTVRAVLATKSLIVENAQLTNAALKTGGATGTAATAAAALTSRLGPLSAAHHVAAQAAMAHALAEERLAAAMGRIGFGGIAPRGGGVPAGFGPVPSGVAGKGGIPPGFTQTTAGLIVPAVAGGAVRPPATPPRPLPGGVSLSPSLANTFPAPPPTPSTAARLAAPATAAATIAASLALNALPDAGDAGIWKRIAQGGFAGAGFGSLAGLVNPALALPGAVIGGLGGGIVASAGELGSLAGTQTAPGLTDRVLPDEQRRPIFERLLAEMEKNNELLSGQNAILEGIAHTGKGVVSGRAVPMRDQIEAIRAL
jgi:tape measure domain-containing protein